MWGFWWVGLIGVVSLYVKDLGFVLLFVMCRFSYWVVCEGQVCRLYGVSLFSGSKSESGHNRFSQ